MKNTYKVNKEAVEKIAERVYDNGSTVINRNDLEEMFPELAESEDEKIRKWLIRTLKALNTAGVDIEGVYEMMLPSIAWLEKQGEQKPAEWSEEDETGWTNTMIMIKECAANHYNKDSIKLVVDWLESLKNRILPQAKQEWSEEDERIRQRLITFCTKSMIPDGVAIRCEEWLKSLRPQPKPAWSEQDDEMYKKVETAIDSYYAPFSRDTEEMSEWFKNLKDRVQPKQEWSEEDEENFARVDYACLKVYGGDSYSSDWLRKFLGIHKKWKPSDEQMEYLAKAILTLGNEGDCKTASILNELRTDLKKL